MRPEDVAALFRHRLAHSRNLGKDSPEIWRTRRGANALPNRPNQWSPKVQTIELIWVKAVTSGPREYEFRRRPE